MPTPIIGMPTAPTAEAIACTGEEPPPSDPMRAAEQGQGQINHMNVADQHNLLLDENNNNLDQHSMRALTSIKREIRKIRYELVDNEHAHWRGTERMLYVMGFAIFLLLLLIVLKLYSGTLKVESQ